MENNATVQYLVSGWGWEKIKTERGRVTNKRVAIQFTAWDKAGTKIGASGMYKYELIAYQIDGHEKIVIKKRDK